MYLWRGRTRVRRQAPCHRAYRIADRERLRDPETGVDLPARLAEPPILEAADEEHLCGRGTLVEYDL
jgi:hypothetical protein